MTKLITRWKFTERNDNELYVKVFLCSLGPSQNCVESLKITIINLSLRIYFEGFKDNPTDHMSNPVFISLTGCLKTC